MNKLKNISKSKIRLVDHFISKWSALRFLVSIFLGSSIGIILIYLSHLTYWKQTIFRTQTVDFNMLAATLPSKISEHLVNKDYLEVQRTIDSNYGLFGIVITNCTRSINLCPEQDILFVSSGTVVKENDNFSIKSKGIYSKNWQKNLSREKLKNDLYLLLRSPHPSTAEMEFKTARSDFYTNTNRTNKGNVIGRIYLLRNPPPPFFSELLKWFSSPFSESSTSSLLFMGIGIATLSTSFAVWILYELLYFANKNANETILITKQNLLLSKIEQSELKTNFLIAQNDRIKAENNAFRYKALWEGFHESFDRDFSSVLANKLEELKGLFRRLDVDIDNIVHDMRKAPLLSIRDNRCKRITEIIESHLSHNENTNFKDILKNIVDFINDSESTINSIDWVLKDLREVANIESSIISVHDTISKFLSNRPPSPNHKWLSINYDYDIDSPIFISCNDWHLRSILKNAIYNSTAALINHHADMDLSGIDFIGKISIKNYIEGDMAVIEVTDNGPGFPTNILSNLYQTAERVNTSSVTRGRGSLIVYSYLRLHQGWAKVNNLPNTGAQVRFYFPSIDTTISEDIIVPD